jgi:signal peptidase I
VPSPVVSVSRRMVMITMSRPATESSPVTPAQELTEFFKSISLILAIALFIRCELLEPFFIPSGSMIPTLQIEDRIFVCKFCYGIRLPFVKKTALEYNQPKRKQIVVFHRNDDPATTSVDEGSDAIVKRVIGLPGETVQVKGTQVFINGTLLDEPYARWEDGGKPEGDFGPVTVPVGHVFLLGDNRDNSKDSRYWTDNNFLPIGNIVGRAFIIFWSWYDFGRIGRLL